MKTRFLIVMAIAMPGAQADPVLAGGGSRPQAHGVSMPQPQLHQRGQHSLPSREPVQHEARGPQGQIHSSFGGPTLEQRSDPNNQNPYRPMFSLDAMNPGEQHPYYQTRKEGFGYPVSRPSAVYLGNGQYFIPR